MRDNRFALLFPVRSLRLGGKQFFVGDPGLIPQFIGDERPPVDPDAPGKHRSAVLIDQSCSDAVPLMMKEGRLHLEWRQHAKVFALRLVLVPSELPGEPLAQTRPIAIDVVTLLHQHDIGLDFANDRQCLLGSLLHVVAAVKDVPHHDANAIWLHRCRPNREDHTKKQTNHADLLFETPAPYLVSVPAAAAFLCLAICLRLPSSRMRLRRRMASGVISTSSSS